MSKEQKRKYPREFNSMNKGDTIPDSLIASICDCKVNSAAFALRRLAIGQSIEAYFKAAGVVVTTAVIKNELHILTDAEASDRNFHRTTLRTKGLRRDHRRNLGVDVSLLSTDQRQQHDRHLCRQGQMVLAIRIAVDIPIDLVPVARRTPG